MVRGLVEFKLGLKKCRQADVIEGSLQVWENNIFKGKIRNNEEICCGWLVAVYTHRIEFWALVVHKCDHLHDHLYF